MTERERDRERGEKGVGIERETGIYFLSVLTWQKQALIMTSDSTLSAVGGGAKALESSPPL